MSRLAIDKLIAGGYTPAQASVIVQTLIKPKGGNGK